MLVRLIVKNLFSFQDEVEFHMIPGQASRLKHHKYKIGEKELLKLSAIYGANGSGKSNLVKALILLKQFILSGNIPTALQRGKFKLSKISQSFPVEMGIEFYFQSSLFFYSCSMDQGKVLEEYLCTINPKTNDDELIFSRKSVDQVNEVKFFEDFYHDPEAKVLSGLISKDLLKPNQSLIKVVESLSNAGFDKIKQVYNWFNDQLTIITPSMKAANIALNFDLNPALRKFADDIICSIGAGISSVDIEKKDLEHYKGAMDAKEFEELITNLQQDPKKIAQLEAADDELFAVNENGKIVTKRLFLQHNGQEDKNVPFSFSQESDGTRRIIEYIPALYRLINEEKVFVIDEIERSIHPILIKELISKFSLDEMTKGQLIFTTHESNLLDQRMLRTDEIWFVEKNKVGSTNIYSLSEYKEHNTIDIRKGYLNGRYGAIPFIANLQDLNWHKYVD
ncbi:ATP/GTP-binding protein [Pedobacter sp. R20-19]|uniref:AAA family ATPase n=1 Tax=Pedobacter sp. R20-19 TaxID=1270196 RepID=UPI000493648C|nr:ATP-binding protein [Pedobacter sp. R20-19]